MAQNNRKYKLNVDEHAYKRFLLFITVQYYPSGGMADCENSFDTLEEVMASIRNDYRGVSESFEIFDCVTRKIIWVEANETEL